jgi:hypothetical protein
MQNAIVGLLSSRKALIVLVIVAFCAAAVLMGKATWEQVEGLVWKVVGPYMIAQGFEDAAKHNAMKAPTVTTPQTINVSVPSNAPPAMPPGDG